ncbi:MAG: energy transducer TonB [Acidobacteriota bacterium]|nr:energy transducer TonB [Acidobacteriota bacterium]
MPRYLQEIAGLLLLALPHVALCAHKAPKPRGIADSESIAGLPVIEERIKLSAPAPVPVTLRKRAATPAAMIPPPPPLQSKPPRTLAYSLTKQAPAAPRAGATVILEQVNPSFARRAVNRVPLLSKLESRQFRGGDNFVAARPVGEITPAVPRDVRAKINGIVPVDLRISIDKTGAVAETELLSRKVDPALAGIAVRAASHWDFTPARINNRPVSSEMLVHMRFGEAR